MRTVICDGEQEFRQTLRSILERQGMDVIGEASNRDQALDQVKALAPDVVIVDMNTETTGGSEFWRRLRQAGLHTQVAVMARFEEEESVLELFRSGVRAYVLKNNIHADLPPALRNLARGKRFLSPGALRRVIEPYPSSKSEKPKNLSALETELLRLLALDVPKNDISVRLSISVEAVEELRKKIMETLKAINNGALVRYSIRNGLQRN